MDKGAIEVNSSTTAALTICLVGMPNAGKTTMMNILTGGNFHTANYPGVTVTLIKGRSKAEYGVEALIVDLPGVNSCVSPSLEEELSCSVLEGRHESVRPDVLVLVVDATQLERHLKLAGYAARSGKPIVVALTMTDLLPRIGRSIDPERLSAVLRVPVVAVDPRSGSHVKELMEKVCEVAANGEPAEVLAGLPEEPEAAYSAINSLVMRSGAVCDLIEKPVDSVTARIDSLVLHRYFGFPIFFLVLALLFASIFWVAQPFMDGIDAFFSSTQNLLVRSLPTGFLTELLAEGIVGGIGSVVVFFPQIVILFFLMTLLEDSGYLARGAALVDRPLSFLGLHGRSFVPMLSGFACAIPAAMATRAIPTRRERFLTVWIVPLMSCSARLPVYSLLLAALLAGEASWKAGLGLASIYISSLLTGALVAGIASRLLSRRRSLSILAMELPAYRKPQLRPILRMTWTRSSSYLRKAAIPIVTVSTILWLLSNYGFAYRQSHLHPNPGSVVRSELDNSFAAQLGQWMEPALRPMGVDWRVGVGLISAFAAREVFVSSMAIVFHVASTDDEVTQQEGLLKQMRSATFSNTSQQVFTPSSITGLIIFFFFSLQCISTVAVVRRETSTRFALLQLGFYTSFGYLMATAMVQSLRAIGLP